MDTKEFEEYVRSKCESLSWDARFKLKDLFTGTVWSGLEKGKRLWFGKLFKQWVLEGKFAGVSSTGRDGNHHCLYQKIASS